MSIAKHPAGERRLYMGNEAIARGALEAGVSVAAGYPGTPSSEIIETLAKAAKDADIYVEWSTNEKVAMEVAAAASFAGLRSLCIMKQNGVNVASDFLLHLAGSGTRGGMVLVPCDDPGALSSVNEGESRHFAKMVEVPLLEPADFQEAKDLTKWAFTLSEELRSLVFVRSVTRLSHASGTVVPGEIPAPRRDAKFTYNGFILDPMEGPVMSAPVTFKHGQQQEKLKRAEEIFEDSPFNTYAGPDNPELLVIATSACWLYAREALRMLNAEGKAGLLKLATTWPLPRKLVKKHLAAAGKVLVLEEVLPFTEENVKVLAQEAADEIGHKPILGKRDGHVPMTGELNPDLAADAVAKALGAQVPEVDPDYKTKAGQYAFFGAPNRDLTFCPGCPHRASFWSIHNTLAADGREGFVCGDIGCYSMAVLPSGFSTLKTLHSMGSGTGLASGFGKLGPFGLNQPVMSVCGDSTFFHAALPALVNAVHHQSDITMAVLDNSGTGMTGFQSHPGLPTDALGNEVPAIDIEAVCRSLGAEVRVTDPFDLEKTQQTLHELLETKKGVKVLILRQACALSPQRKGKKDFDMEVDAALCRGEDCGCNRLCTRIFRCPGLVWDATAGRARIDEVICAGCGVCASICPAGAIIKKPVSAQAA
ncbi:MAG: indolepyruvate ferredoxin oxidoreductase [Deltaproteobacteria bacterium]|nr:indolepyruvate ferredoxin oxidoreductase [Deltaproteobacteria bacterium]